MDRSKSLSGRLVRRVALSVAGLARRLALWWARRRMAGAERFFNQQVRKWKAGEGSYDALVKPAAARTGAIMERLERLQHGPGNPWRR